MRQGGLFGSDRSPKERGEGGEFFFIDVGGRPERHRVVGPMEKMEATRRGEAVDGRGRRFWRVVGPDEEVDGVLVAVVDERGDGLVVDDIEAATDQRKAVGSKVAHGRGEGKLSRKPRFDGVLVGGDDVHEVLRLERTHVGGFNGIREERKLGLRGRGMEEEHGEAANDEEKRRGDRQFERGEGTRGAGGLFELAAQRGRDSEVRQVFAQGLLKGLAAAEERGAACAVLKMGIEFGGMDGIKLGVEVGINQILGALTFHRRPPWRLRGG
jgi:hypothetical protein